MYLHRHTVNCVRARESDKKHNSIARYNKPRGDDNGKAALS